jgi:hypothetical protein
MKMKMARRTSALGRVEAERHQANEQRAYSSFGESLHKKRKKMKHMAWSEKKKCCPFASVSLVERKGEACSHAMLNIGEE